MTRKARDKIAAGLREAISVARGDGGSVAIDDAGLSRLRGDLVWRELNDSEVIALIDELEMARKRIAVAVAESNSARALLKDVWHELSGIPEFKPLRARIIEERWPRHDRR